jgi:N-ATPase, AtpR subunit
MNGLGNAWVLASCLGIGMLAGWAHFALLRWNAGLYLRPAGFGRAIGLQMLRLVLLGAVLAVLAREGALPLLLGALGVLLARRVVLRRTRLLGVRRTTGAAP